MGDALPDAVSSRARAGVVMRILMAGTFIYPRGAAGRASQMQARGLAEAGHHITVAMARGENAERQIAVDGFTVLTFGSVAEMTGGLAGRFRWVTAQVGLLIYLLKAVLGGRFDSLMFYGVAPIFAAVAVIARLWKQPTCLIQYDLLETSIYLGFWDYIQRQLIIGSEKVLARCAALIIIGYSSALEAVFQRIAPRTPRVKVWPPTDTTYFASSGGGRVRNRWGLNDCKLVAYAGSISRLEGIDVLLEAMSVIRSQYPGLKLVLAGPVEHFDPVGGRPLNFELTAKKIGVEDSVLFVGMLPRDQVVDLLAAADCLVMPKVDHPVNAVASPIKVGEYLASGRPVVASRVCELDMWLRHGEDIWLCRPGDPADLAAAIVRVLTDEALAQRLGANGQIAARRVCDYRVWAQRVEAALKDLRSVSKPI